MTFKVTALKADGHAYRWWWAEVDVGDIGVLSGLEPVSGG